MSYFDDVYLKRINRYGNTLQDRIQGKREHDFIVMMNKSPNKVEVREVNPWKNDTNYYDGVLQTKEYDEDEIQNYLLVPCDQKVPMGHLLYFTDVRRDVEREKPFMAYAEDPYTTAGYNRYTVVELEETLDWIVDGVPYSSPVHATGGGSGARDKNINLKFRIQFSEAGVYLPNKRYSLIMPYNEAIKKNHRVTLGGETWRITGFDKISVSGVMYLTLEEALTDVNDDHPVANTDEYKNWSFTFDCGEELHLIENASPITTTICGYYHQTERTDISLIVRSKDPHIDISGKLKNYHPGDPLQFTAITGATNTDLVLQIKNADFDYQYELPIYVDSVSNQGIVGPDVIHMGDVISYTITGVEVTNATAVPTTIASVKSFSENTIQVEGLNIGQVSLIINPEATQLSKEINVVSIWLGG